MSIKQKRAQERNHLIMRLRGAYTLCKNMTTHDADYFKMAIDNTLLKLAAEPESIRNKRLRDEVLALGIK